MGPNSKYFWIALLLLAVSLAVVSAAWPEDYMGCSVRQGNGTKILGLASITNSHAELPSESNYLYGVFCSLNGTASTGQTILHLSNYTNAHLELNTSNLYSYDVGIGYEYGDLFCRYSNCSWYESCLVGLSNYTNAHAESCSEGNYPHTVCCYAVDKVVPEIEFSSGSFLDGEISNSSTPFVNLSINETSYRSSAVFDNETSVLFVRFDNKTDFFGGPANVSSNLAFGVFGESGNLSTGNVSAYRNYSGHVLFVSLWFRGSGFEAAGKNWIINSSGFYIYNGSWFSSGLPASDGKWHFYAGWWNGTNISTYYDASEYSVAEGPSGWLNFTGNISLSGNGLADDFLVMMRKPDLLYMNKSLHTLHQEYPKFWKEGNYTVYGFVEDMSGNWNVTGNRTYVYDATPPVLSIDEPVNNSYVSMGVVINTTAYDNLSGISTVSLYINGSFFRENDTENPSFFWNTSLYRNGPYNFTLHGCDRAGNCNQTGIYVFTVNNSIIVQTEPEHEIDVNGTSETIIWANASRNDGTPETNETADAFINFSSSGSSQMSWNSTRWEYLANATQLGSGVGDHNYSVLVNDSGMNMSGWGFNKLHVDDLYLIFHNLSTFYYSLEPIGLVVETRRATNNSLEVSNVSAYLKNGTTIRSEGNCAGSNCSIVLNSSCVNSDAHFNLSAISDTLWLEGNKRTDVLVKPRADDLKCGFDPNYLNWNYSEKNVTVWCYFEDMVSGGNMTVEWLSVNITDGNPSYTHDCEGSFNLSDFSWNPLAQRYEMNCTLKQTSVPADCLDLSLNATAGKQCYDTASNQTSLVINCPPSCGAPVIIPKYIDVNRTAEEFEMRVNVSDYDGNGDVSVEGRKENQSYEPMTKSLVLSETNATFSLNLGHESSVSCFGGDVHVVDTGGLTCDSTTSENSCGEDMNINYTDGCNQTIYWGETAVVNATAHYETDNSIASGNATCYLFNGTRVSDNSTSFNENMTCGLTPPKILDDTNFTVGINATAVRSSTIDGNTSTGCWLFVKLRKMNIDCSYPDKIDYTEPFSIECNVTDSLGNGVTGADMEIQTSGKCTPFQAWTDEGNGNYSYSCYPEMPGTVDFNITATSSGYEVGRYSGTFYVRYVERQEVVDLFWNNQPFTTYPQMTRQITSFDTLKYRFACISSNFTTGIMPLGDPTFISKYPLTVQEKETGNLFVVPITTATCDEVARKSVSFVRKGDVTSSFSSVSGSPSHYYVVVKSPLPILNDTSKTGTFSLVKTDDGVVVK